MSDKRFFARVADAAYRSRSLWIHNAASLGYFLRQDRLNRGSGSRRSSPQSIAEVSVEPELPRLAWLGVLEGSAWTFRIGSSVSRSPRGFFEGVWAGDFAAFDPEKARYVFGSGAIESGGRVQFVGPTHPQEPLIVVIDKSERRAMVSNSLAFIFQAAALEPDHGFGAMVLRRVHAHVWQHFKWGADRARTLVVEDERYELHVCAFFRFEITNDLSVRRQWVPARREFRSFSQYRSLMHRVARELVENAGAVSRTDVLDPVVSVSRGYDSVAAASVVAVEGCRRALTIDANVDHMDDSGAEIAAVLGLEIMERPHVLGAEIVDLRADYARALMPDAAEFFATVGIGDMVVFAPFEPELQNALLFTGIWGDGIWERDTEITSGYPAQIQFNKSVTEFRIRVGFAHVQLPVVGARFAHAVRSLSRHASMRQYSVGGNYDRPIPRRLAEERGVGREMFGTKKNAQNPLLLEWEAVVPEAMALTAERYRPVRAGAPEGE